MRRLFLLFKSLPLQILVAIAIAYSTTYIVGYKFITIAYTISTVFKDLLMIVLPLITFTYMFYAMLKFSQKAPFLLLLILISLIISNALSFNLGLLTSYIFLPHIISKGSIVLQETKTAIKPLFIIDIPSFWTPAKGLVMGLVLGVILSLAKSKKLLDFASKIRNFATLILEKCFIPFIPIFIMGFIYKFHYEKLIHMLIKSYGKVLCFTISFMVTYLLLFMFITNKFYIGRTIRNLKSYLTIALTAFTTMSSLAALPLALNVTKNNTRDEDYTNFVLPTVVNIHTIGDSIIFSTTIIALIYLFGIPLPTFHALLIFIYYYCLSRFSVAGVPAGSTIITLPLVSSYLGFSTEMLGVFSTVCILQDCLISTGNILGNCLFTQFTYNLFGQSFMKQVQDKC